MITGILIFTLAPNTMPDWDQFHWPSNPDKSVAPATIVHHADHQLIEGQGLEAVQRHCLSCHSSRLIIQNKMSRERWEENIRWMQATQGLWDLGTDHPIVIEYLATHYAPQAIGRRSPLSDDQLEWYLLE